MGTALVVAVCACGSLGCTDHGGSEEEAPAVDVAIADGLDPVGVDDVGDDKTSAPDSGPPPCFGDGPAMDDPRHLYQAVRLEALADERLLDSVTILDGGRDACTLHPDTVEDIDFEPNASIEECLGPPDGVLDAGTRTSGLATEMSQRGQTMLLSFGGVVGPGDVIEVRDAAACDGNDTPTFRVSIAFPGRLDDRHIVVGEVSGPIGRITVPEDIFD